MISPDLLRARRGDGAWQRHPDGMGQLCRSPCPETAARLRCWAEKPQAGGRCVLTSQALGALNLRAAENEEEGST